MYKELRSDYIEYLWNYTGLEVPMPKITALIVDSQQVVNIAQADVGAYSTPLMPKMDSYLIIISFKDTYQFNSDLQMELVRICSDGYVKSLQNQELIDFQQIVDNMALSKGVKAPRLLFDNSLYF